MALAAAAYLPQIMHLVRVHCAAGISRSAFRAWLFAALLITTHAVAAQSHDGYAEAEILRYQVR